MFRVAKLMRKDKKDVRGEHVEEVQGDIKLVEKVQLKM